MNEVLVENRVIMIALIGICIYVFFVLIDLVKTKRDNKWRNTSMIKSIAIASIFQQVMA